MMRIIDVSHALWLRHIDLRKMPIEKDIVDIKLANVLLTIKCNAKHSMNGDEIYHERRSPLGKALLTSSWPMSYLRLSAMLSKVWTMMGFITRLKVL